MKFLVYGAQGWIGQHICSILNNAGDEVCEGSRVYALENVVKDLHKHQPQLVISALGRTFGAGYMSIDYLEQAGKLTENLRCNLVAPLLIAQATFASEIPMLYIGSGCIFEYDRNHTEAGSGFTEEDSPNFDGSAYSAVKGQTEVLLRAFPNVLTARIRMPITLTEYPRDFITKILKYKSIASVKNSMTILHEFLPFLIASAVDGKTGVINATNPGIIDHDTILKMYQEIFQTKLDYSMISLDEQKKILLSGRSNNKLDTSKAEFWLKTLPKELRDKYGCGEVFLNISDSIRQILLTRRQAKSRAIVERPLQMKKTILVTGGAGFIGSNFVNFWVEKYQNDFLVNLDALQQNSSLKNIGVSERSNYRFVEGSLLDESLLNALCKEYNFTHIIHFAAASTVDGSFVRPVLYTEVNVLGTHFLLEAVRQHCPSLNLFTHISTDEVYGECEKGEFDEDTALLFPTNPYAATKAAAECLMRSYGKSYRIPYLMTRANNVYGRNQYPSQVIPRFIVQLLKGRKMPVHGNGHTSRRFLHVMDKCRAIELLLQRGQEGEIYNIGTRNEVSVLDLCHRLLRKMKGTDADAEKWIEHVKDRPYNDCRYAINSSKLERLGWRAQVDFDKGLDETIAWYSLNHHSHWDEAGKTTKVTISTENVPITVTNGVDSPAVAQLTDTSISFPQVSLHKALLV